LEAEQFSARIVDLGVLAQRGAWAPELSLLASALTGVVLLAMAAYEFVHTDY
jgi:hypothetical protein